MTRAQEKAARRVAAITRAAGEALRRGEAAEFLRLFPESDVSLKYIINVDFDTNGVEVDTDLFSMACCAVKSFGNDDLAKMVANRMIREGVDLRTRRTHRPLGYTPLMMAAAFCGESLVEQLLPLSDVEAKTLSEAYDAEGIAEFFEATANAAIIRRFKSSRNLAAELDDLIPVPPSGPKKNIDD